MDNIVRNYTAALYYSRQFYPSLSFAWEKQNADSSIINFSIQGTNDAEVLVVIGYSFPFFNREVDREIIGAMKNLKIVYFQSPEANSLRDRFYGIRPDIAKDHLHPITDVYQFFLPPEL